ncbi:MAG: hypothetical protein GY895_07060 [Phycisphaera sp.]|nr:hypothetical protein [Phycisphaera sp.]
MNRLSIAMILVLAAITALDRPSHGQGARGLPDPISSSSLSNSLQESRPGDSSEAHESLMAGPVDRYQAAFRELRNGPIEDWLDARRSLSRGFMTTQTVKEAKEDTRDRQRLLTRIAELDARLFQDLLASGLEENIVGRAADARRRDRALTTMGRRYARSLRLEPMDVLAETTLEIRADQPDWNVPPTVREILEAYERERTIRMERLSTLAMKVPVGVAERLSKLAPAFSDPSTLQPEDFDQWFADRRAANASARADAIRELESIKTSEKETLRAVLAVAETDPVFAAAFESNWNPTTIMPGSPFEILPPVDLPMPEGTTVTIEEATPMEVPDSAPIGFVVLSGDGVDLPEGLAFSVDMDDLAEEAFFIDTPPGFDLGFGGLDSGLARAIDAAEFKAACSRLKLDETSRSIADILFREYRDAYSVITETLVADWKDTPRNLIGLGGGTAATERDLDRAAGLRLSILEEIMRIDQALFTDLAVMLEDREAVDREIRRRGRVACLGTSGIGTTGRDAGIKALDLELIADGSLDPGSRAMISGILNEWSIDYRRSLEEWTRSTVRLDRDEQVLQMKLFAEAMTGGGVLEMRIDGGEEDLGTEMGGLEGRMMDLSRRRLAIETTATKEMQDWIDRIAQRLGPDSLTSFQIECEKVAWPSCFMDPRSPADNFEIALGLENLDQTTRLAIETLKAEWGSKWLEACRRLVEITRSRQSIDAMMSDQEFDPTSLQKAKADGDRIRFDRDELDERVMRDLKALLSPEDQARIGDLPEKPAARRGLSFPIDLESFSEN